MGEERHRDRIHEVTDLIRCVVDHPEAFPERFVSVPFDLDLILMAVQKERGSGSRGPILIA